ncbi:MAG: RNA polymerase sigma factor [Gaiellaceae bacterium]
MRGAVLAPGYIPIVASVAIDDRGIPPDEAASTLFEEHSEWLLAFCTRQLRDCSDAEDAVQGTFLHAFRALRNGVVPECERAWLTTIAKNVCHTHRRTSRRRPESAMEPDLDRIALAQPDHEEVGFMDDVRAALSSLPPNQRRALLRREWQGVPSSEIADELHLSAPATDALLFRARKSFATAMSASGRPFGGLNVLILLDQLRGWLKLLVGGAAVKAAVATTAASVVVGGVVIEQRSDTDVPPPRPVGSSATVVATWEPSPAASRLAPTPVVTRKGQVAPPAAAPATGSARESASPVAAETDAAITRLARPPKGAAEPSTAPASPPPSAKAPTPTSAAPADPPVPPPPLDLAPILGEEPLVPLPPPVEDLLPPASAPLPPLPPLAPPLPPLLP